MFIDNKLTAEVNAMHDYRRALGQFATGITIVTALDAQGKPVGLTANSFTSVSLKPRLISWSLGKASKNAPAFLDAEGFCVNVLTSRQQVLSDRFANGRIDKYEGVDWEPSTCGAPKLKGVAAHFECRLHSAIEAGDHYMFLGEVVEYSSQIADPLLFVAGSYARVERASAAS